MLAVARRNIEMHISDRAQRYDGLKLAADMLQADCYRIRVQVWVRHRNMAIQPLTFSVSRPASER